MPSRKINFVITEQTLEKTMSEKTKVVLYTIVLLAIFISWSIYSDKERESCESIGGVYARQNMGWSFECKTNPAEAKP